MASQRYLTLISCTASQASFWIWNLSITRWALGKQWRTIFRILSDKPEWPPQPLHDPAVLFLSITFQASSAFVPAITATRQPFFPCFRPCWWLLYKVRHWRELFIYGQIWPDVLRNRSQSWVTLLVPVPVKSENLLILLFKLMSVYMIEFLKRTAGHWGCLHT